MIKSLASVILILAATAMAVCFVATTSRCPKVDVQASARPMDQRIEQEYRQTIDSTGAKRLRIKAHIAELTLRTSPTNKLVVHAVRWYKGVQSESAKQWMGDSRLIALSDGDEISVVDKTSMDEFHNSAGGNLNCGLDLQVDVPSGLKLTGQIDAGTAVMYGKYESVAFRVGAGTLQANLDPCPAGSSNFNLGAGELELHLPPMANVNLSASAGVGQIFGLPAKEKTSGSGLHLGETRTVQVGNGGPAIELHVGAGSIKLEASDGLSTAKDLRTVMTDNGAAQILETDGDRPVSDARVKAALKDLGPQIEASMKDAKPDMDRDLAKIGPEIENAMRQAQPEIDRALAEAGQEVARAIAEVGPQIDKEMAKARPEFEKAIKEAQKERALKGEDKEWGAEQQAELKEAQVEVTAAEHEAERAMAEAMAELNKQFDDKGTRDRVQKSMRSAQASIRAALKMARQSLQQIHKQKSH